MALNEHDAASLKGFYDHRIETYKSLITLSVEIFKYLALLNGGAAAGVLTTFDNLSKHIDVGSLKVAVMFFVGGLLMNGVAVVSSYFTQLTLYDESIQGSNTGRHMRHLGVAILSCLFSLASFSFGALQAVYHAH